MENVKGMLSSTVESRLVFQMLMEDLASLGSGHGHQYELRAIWVEDGGHVRQAGVVSLMA
jgi:DNA (cytosine-5)-methyltransferase 1